MEIEAISIQEAYEQLSTSAFAVWIRILVEPSKKLFGRKKIAKKIGYSTTHTDLILKELRIKGFIKITPVGTGNKSKLTLKKRIVLPERSGFVTLANFLGGMPKNNEQEDFEIEVTNTNYAVQPIDRYSNFFKRTSNKKESSVQNNFDSPSSSEIHDYCDKNMSLGLSLNFQDKKSTTLLLYDLQNSQEKLKESKAIPGNEHESNYSLLGRTIKTGKKGEKAKKIKRQRVKMPFAKGERASEKASRKKESHEESRESLSNLEEIREVISLVKSKKNKKTKVKKQKEQEQEKRQTKRTKKSKIGQEKNRKTNVEKDEEQTKRTKKRRTSRSSKSKIEKEQEQVKRTKKSKVEKQKDFVSKLIERRNKNKEENKKRRIAQIKKSKTTKRAAIIWDKLDQKGDPVISFSMTPELRAKLIKILNQSESSAIKKKIIAKIGSEFEKIYTRYRRMLQVNAGLNPSYVTFEKEKKYAEKAAELCIRKEVTPKQVLEYWHKHIKNFANAKMLVPPLAFLTSPANIDTVVCSVMDVAEENGGYKKEAGHSFCDEDELDPKLRPGLEGAGLDTTEYNNRHLLTIQKTAEAVAKGARIFVDSDMKPLTDWAAENLYKTDKRY